MTGVRGCQTEVGDAEIEGCLRHGVAASARHTAQGLGEVHAGSRCAQRDEPEEFDHQLIVGRRRFDAKFAGFLVRVNGAPEASCKVADELQQGTTFTEHCEL